MVRSIALRLVLLASLCLVGSQLGSLIYSACLSPALAAAPVCTPQTSNVSLTLNGNATGLNMSMDLTCTEGGGNECNWHYKVTIFNAGGQPLATTGCRAFGPRDCDWSGTCVDSWPIPGNLPIGNKTATLGVWPGGCPEAEQDPRTAPKKSTVSLQP